MTNCLTYDQLKAYSSRDIVPSERESIYMHISTCELCACAVNGFSAFPFASDDLVAIHREIDVRTNATAAKPLTFAQVFIVIVSLISIFCVYKVSDLKSVKKELATVSNKETIQPVILTTNETKSESQKEISVVTKTFKKIVNEIRHEKFEKKLNVTEVEAISPIAAVLVEPEVIKPSEGEVLLPVFNSDVIYLYDLKVTDYNKLYFGTYKSASANFKTHTPVFKETKESIADDFGVETHIVPADRVLKEGLGAFNKQKFKRALENFDLLIENNPKDINARFYAGLSNYNLQRMDKALAHLAIVLEDPNNTFYPEAQYYQAIANLRTGERVLAKQQLETIVAEKGFYAKRAKERLKAL